MPTLAFTFHRTAFQERLEDVAKATKVIDHLKDYRPKKQGAGTHMSLLNLGGFGLGGGKVVAEPGSMEEGHAKNDYSDTEDDHDQKQPKKGFLGFKPKSQSGSASASSSKTPSRQSSRMPMQQPPHVYPPVGSGTNSPRGRTSHEEPADVLHSAARVLRTAVLHDARGLRGDTIAEEDFGPGLSSAHEAKVSCPFVMVRSFRG